MADVDISGKSWAAGADIPFAEAVALANDRDRGLEAASLYTIARDKGFDKKSDKDDAHTSRIIVQMLKNKMAVGFHDPAD